MSVSPACCLRPACPGSGRPEQIDQGRVVIDDLVRTCHGRDMVATGALVFDLRKFPKDDCGRFRNSCSTARAPMPPWQGKSATKTSPALGLCARRAVARAQPHDVAIATSPRSADWRHAVQRSMVALKRDRRCDEANGRRQETP